MRWLLALVLLAGCARPSLPPAPVAPAVVSTLDQQAQVAQAVNDPQTKWSSLSAHDKQTWRDWVIAIEAWEKASGQTYPMPPFNQ